MINPQSLKLPMSRTNFHGLIDVRTIEVQLYSIDLKCPNAKGKYDIHDKAMYMRAPFLVGSI